MRFLLRAIFWLALAYALIPARAPVPASLKTTAPPAPEHAPEQAQASSKPTGETSLARDAITLCLDNTQACARGVEAVGRIAEMARAAGAHFTADPAATTTPAAIGPAATPAPATQVAPVPLPQERPGNGL